jgi:3-deoxy-D-manno-octulosonate 8-phosphate phosphatase (KDO 8-P phosphatase)
MELARIKAMVFDVDGVFTNNQLIITEQGELLRTMNTRDGYAVKRAIENGLHLAIITGGSSEGTRIRLANLGIKDIYTKISDKKSTLKNWMSNHGYKPEDVLYMGDDYPDFEVLQIAGYPCCPADADPSIMKLCKYISPFKGGEGCVRDIIEKVLLAQDNQMI